MASDVFERICFPNVLLGDEIIAQIKSNPPNFRKSKVKCLRVGMVRSNLPLIHTPPTPPLFPSG